MKIIYHCYTCQDKNKHRKDFSVEPVQTDWEMFSDAVVHITETMEYGTSHMMEALVVEDSQ